MKFVILCYTEVGELLGVFEKSNLIYPMKTHSLSVIPEAMCSKDALLSELILTLGSNICLKLIGTVIRTQIK